MFLAYIAWIYVFEIPLEIMLYRVEFLDCDKREERIFFKKNNWLACSMSWLIGKE